MLNLLWTNLKMMVRGRQALFWSLFFPLMFTIIFGFFFGGKNTNVGTVALINESKTTLAKNLETAMRDANLFKIRDETDLGTAKDLLRKSTVAAIVDVPADFGGVSGSTEITLISDPANAQANAVISGFLNQFLTSVNYKIQGAKTIYSLKAESTSDSSLTYFDFVLMGLIGLALMNSSIQGIAITLANYREDKILKRITTTPLPSWKFIVAEVLSRLVLNLVQIGLILGVAQIFFNAHIIGNYWLLVLFSLIGGLLFQTIGFAVASVVKTTDAAQGMATAIAIPMMFLAGVFFPIDQLPKWLFSIVQYLPLAPLLRMLRQIGLENLSPFTNVMNIVLVGVWIIVMLSVSVWRFRLSDE